MVDVAAGSRHSAMFTPESTFGTTPTAVVRNDDTISAAAADNSYNDAGGGLDVFKAGDIILVSGFTTAANNGLKHVVSAVANKLIVDEALTVEAVGEDIVIAIGWPRLRNKGTTLGLGKDTFKSEEIRADRQIRDLRHGNKRVEGEFPVEMSAVSFDDLIEAAMQGEWSLPGTGAILKAGTTQRSVSVARLMEDIGEMILYEGVMVNTFSLSAQLNSMIQATFGLVGQSAESPTHVMTVLPGGAAIEITDIFTLSDKDGNELISFEATAGTVANVVAGLVAAWNASTNPICELYTAVDVATTHMTLTADTPGVWYEVVPTTTDGGGADTQTMILTHAPVRPAGEISTTEPFDSFTGVIKEGGDAIATVTGLDFVLANGLDPAHVLMNAETTQFINGRSDVTGTVTAYLSDVTLYNKFVNETSTTLELEIEDPVGNKLNFKFPNVKYLTGDVPVADEGPVMLTLQFQALYDATELTNLKITRTLV